MGALPFVLVQFEPEDRQILGEFAGFVLDPRQEDDRDEEEQVHRQDDAGDPAERVEQCGEDRENQDDQPRPPATAPRTSR
jgi:hypothetical protein